MSSRQRRRQQLGTTSRGSCPTPNGKQIQRPYEVLSIGPYYSAAEYTVMFGAVHVCRTSSTILDDAISDIIQKRFTVEIEQLNLSLDNAKPAKGDRTCGNCTSVVEPETLVHAPLLIKTMVAVMGHHMSNMKQLLEMKDKRINSLEERLDVLDAEVDKREQYSRRPNLCFQGIPETENETTNELFLQTVNEKMGMQLTLTKTLLSSIMKTGQQNEHRWPIRPGC